jgi:long-chain fatty acid transport protein
MRRIKLLLAILLVGHFAFAGGIVTNTNQSAAYIRMLARDASTDVDAVFYNPAALTKLNDGFHIQLNTQTVFQDRGINNSYLDKDFKGEVFAPIVPTFFAAYKTGDFAFSAGFTVIGGGGSANFDQGLPDFEYAFKGIPTLLTSVAGIPTNNYSADITFSGTSIYYGAQAGVSYAINDNISVFAGARYVIVHNGYEGHIKDVKMNPTYPVLGYNGDMVVATDFFHDLEAAATSTGDLQNAALAKSLHDATMDRFVDVEQNGTGITPIIGANISLMEDRFNIGLKYEFATEIDIENHSYTDDTKGMPGMPLGMFPDRSVKASDMPAFLSVGLGYQISDRLYATAGLHYYFDKSVDYGKNSWKDTDPSTGMPSIDADGLPTYDRMGNENWLNSNSYEIGLGLEYHLSETFLVSAGYLHTFSDPTEEYQSGISYSLVSNSIAAGGQFKFGSNLALDLGVLYTMYDNFSKTGSYNVGGLPLGNFTEEYSKSNFVFSLGVTYSFGGSSVSVE